MNHDSSAFSEEPDALVLSLLIILGMGTYCPGALNKKSRPEHSKFTGATNPVQSNITGEPGKFPEEYDTKSR